jgi:hypothetical protein
MWVYFKVPQCDHLISFSTPTVAYPKGKHNSQCYLRQSLRTRWQALVRHYVFQSALGSCWIRHPIKPNHALPMT